MEVSGDAGECAQEATLLRHFDEGDGIPAVGCVVPCSADSLALVLPRPVSIERSQFDVIRVTLASSLAAISWKDLDVVVLSDAACLLCLPWLYQRVSELTSVVCSSALLRLAVALLGDVFLSQHVHFEVAGVTLPMFVTHQLLSDCVRLLSPAYRLSPVPLLGGGTVTAVCSGAEPGSMAWVITRSDLPRRVVVSRRHTMQAALAFGALDECPTAAAAVPQSYIALAGVDERAVVDAAAAARAALAAGGCVLGVAMCPFAIARFISLLKDTKVPMFWMGPKCDDVYDCLHKLAEYCNDDMLQRAYDREAPFVLANALGEISTVPQQDLSCGTECVVVACCPPVDFVTAWTFSKPTANVVLRFQ